MIELIHKVSIHCIAGLSNAFLDEILGSPRLFAMRLAPSVGQSRFYATPQEFCMVCIEQDNIA